MRREQLPPFDQRSLHLHSSGEAGRSAVTIQRMCLKQLLEGVNSTWTFSVCSWQVLMFCYADWSCSNVGLKVLLTVGALQQWMSCTSLMYENASDIINGWVQKWIQKTPGKPSLCMRHSMSWTIAGSIPTAPVILSMSETVSSWQEFFLWVPFPA